VFHLNLLTYSNRANLFTNTDSEKKLKSNYEIKRREDGLPIFPDLDLRRDGSLVAAKAIEAFLKYTWGKLLTALIVSDSRIPEYCRPGNGPIPWDDIEARPSSYYEDFCSVPIQHPSKLSIPDAILLAHKFQTLGKDFLFFGSGPKCEENGTSDSLEKMIPFEDTEDAMDVDLLGQSSSGDHMTEDDLHPQTLSDTSPTLGAPMVAVQLSTLNTVDGRSSLDNSDGFIHSDTVRVCPHIT
jgi:hypothetical protein